MLASDIDYQDGRVGEVFFRRFMPDDRYPVGVDQQATGEKVVFVGTARVRQDMSDSHGKSAYFIPRAWGCTRFMAVVAVHGGNCVTAVLSEFFEK